MSYDFGDEERVRYVRIANCSSCNLAKCTACGGRGWVVVEPLDLITVPRSVHIDRDAEREARREVIDRLEGLRSELARVVGALLRYELLGVIDDDAGDGS